jgi:type II secretory pathway component PulJ
MRSPSQQRGAALIVAIIFLLLLSTLALTGLRASTTNVTIVGNMQARQEVISTAQMLIEQTISTDEFARNPQGVFQAAHVDSDFNGDGSTDAVATLAVPPVCARARRRDRRSRPRTQDAGCLPARRYPDPGSSRPAAGRRGRSARIPSGTSSSRATDARTGAAITLNQGVTMRTAVVGLNTVCQ